MLIDSNKKELTGQTDGQGLTQIKNVGCDSFEVLLDFNDHRKLIHPFTQVLLLNVVYLSIDNYHHSTAKHGNGEAVDLRNQRLSHPLYSTNGTDSKSGTYYPFAVTLEEILITNIAQRGIYCSTTTSNNWVKRGMSMTPPLA